MPDNKQMKTITVIDTFGFLFRSFYALPPLKSKTGFPTGLLTGFMNFVSNIGKDFQTDYIVFALDSKGKTFRNDIYPQYKAHRPDVPEDLLAQLPVAISWIEKMGFKTALKVGFEADDIIASIAHDAVKKGFTVRVVSHDKDLYQLIEDGKVFLFDPIKKSEVTEQTCFDKYGVYPRQFTDYQSLLGDSADNVPGVKGVGAKTAQALIEQFDNLDAIYAKKDSIEKPRWIKLLDESKEMAFISKELVTLKKDIHEIDVIESFTLPEENPILKIEDILNDFDLHRIVQRVHENGLNYRTNMPLENATHTTVKVEQAKKIEFTSVLLNDEKTLFEVIESIPNDSIVAFDTETTSVNTKVAKIVGFSFSYEEGKAYYVPISHFYLGVIEQIDNETATKALLLLNKHKLIVQNFKFDYEIVKNNFGINLTLYADTMLLAWLLNPSSKVGLDFLSTKYFNHKMIAFKEVVKKGEDFSSVDIGKACEYAAEDAYITMKIYEEQLLEFKNNDTEHLIQVAQDVEYDFIKVLSQMQNIGIKVDIKFLEELKIKNSSYIHDLSSKIYELAGGEFNINSPKQLGVILFETLNLPTQKKTKTGYSTNEAVLHKLEGKHDIIPELLNYREAFKLQSTYIEPLLTLGLKDENNRIYTSFLQTGTATGRLSSKDPNLQNIPVRSESGRLIRKAFVASSGYTLVGIDYSQIELRLLAHFSKDTALLEAFNNNLDIHTQTAVKIFGEEKAKENRNVAKSINFGLLYGMGSRKLAETLGISTKEAKQYIESYFEAFSSVKDYMKSIEDFALENGYVETLLNRRRLFDFENAPAMMRASFLRESVNTKFQGSAADLIKLSMNKIHEEFYGNDEMKMLLQIHDELIFEVKSEKVEAYAQSLTQIMEGIFQLEVPLKVSVSIGENWGELK